MREVRPILNQLNLVARDFDATCAFYRRLGLEVPDRPVSPDGIRHAEVTMPNDFTLEFDNHTLARIYNAGWRRPQGGSTALIGFAVEARADVDRIYGELVGAGYEGRQPPYDTFWGARYAIVEDPDGNHVGLMSPSDPARRSAPPAL